MLSFIAELPAEQLREARDRLGKITSAAALSAPAPPLAGVRRRARSAQGCGADATGRGSLECRDPDRPDDVAEGRADHPRRRADRERGEGRRELCRAQLRRADGRPTHRGSLAPGPRSRGLFSFVHQSVMEWLVANRAAEQLEAEAGERHAVDALGRARMSPLMADFFRGLAKESAEPWAQASWRGRGRIRGVCQGQCPPRLETDGERGPLARAVGRRGPAWQAISPTRSSSAPSSSGIDLTEARLIRSEFDRGQLEGGQTRPGRPDPGQAGKGATRRRRRHGRQLPRCRSSGSQPGRSLVPQGQAGRCEARSGRTEALRHVRGGTARCHRSSRHDLCTIAVECNGLEP